MQKQLWRNRWLSSLNELTSIELQNNSWLDKSNTNPHWSFVEFMCSYFDDLFIDENYKYQLNNGLISKAEYSIIKDWHKKLYKYNSPNNEDYNVEAIIKDVNWIKIVDDGIVMRGELEKLISSKEREILNEEVDYLKYK